jgi:hypothetical protein
MPKLYQFVECFEQRTNVPPLQAHGVTQLPERSQAKIGRRWWGLGFRPLLQMHPLEPQPEFSGESEAMIDVLHYPRRKITL